MTSYRYSSNCFKRPSGIIVSIWHTMLHHTFEAIRVMFSLLWRDAFSRFMLRFRDSRRSWASFVLNIPNGDNNITPWNGFLRSSSVACKVYLFGERDVRAAWAMWLVVAVLLIRLSNIPLGPGRRSRKNANINFGPLVTFSHPAQNLGDRFRYPPVALSRDRFVGYGWAAVSLSNSGKKIFVHQGLVVMLDCCWNFEILNFPLFFVSRNRLVW